MSRSRALAELHPELETHLFDEPGVVNRAGRAAGHLVRAFGTSPRHFAAGVVRRLGLSSAS